MSQNNHKDFENQGWEAMFQTLEREMPVKKKRRGAFWLWLFVGTTAVLGSVFLYATKTEKFTKSFIKNSEPIVYDIHLNKNTDTLEAVTTSVTPTATPVFEKQSKISETKTISKTNISNIDSPNPVKNAPLSTTPNSSLTTNLNTSATSFSTPDLINLSKNAPLSITWDSSLTTNLKTATTSFSAVDLLNPAKNAPLSITRDSSLKIGLKPFKNHILTPKRKENKLLWGITTGIHTKKMQGLDGYQVGLTVAKPLSKKWQMSTGLSFRQTKILQQSTTFSYIELQADPNPQIGVIGNMSNTLQKAAPISIDKLKYLGALFAIDHKITKKWALSSGIKLSYLVGQKTITSDTTVFLVKRAYNSATYDILNDVSSSSLGLNRWDAAVLGGIQYAPTRHIQLGLRYDFGLFNNVNRVGKSAYNRYLGLNVVYWF